MKIHVKVGTHPAYYAEVVRKRISPKVGDCLYLKNELVGGNSLRVRCTEIEKECAHGDTLYYMELM